MLAVYLKISEWPITLRYFAKKILQGSNAWFKLGLENLTLGSPAPATFIKKGGRMKKPAIDVANYFLVLVILNIFLHYLIPIEQIIFFPYNLIGTILFIVGWIPNIWVGIYFRKINTSIPAREMPKKLVTNCFFKISRNPVYLGMVIALVGEAIFLGSLVTFIIPILFFILVNQINIPYEEKNLEKVLGRKYLNYKKKVRRWI